MKKTILRIVCFMLVLGATLYGVNRVFKVKYSDGIYSMTKFYELDKNSVDVLFLGSSHAFENFNTGTMWDEFGNASYILGGSFQPLWNTYYYLKEALKTQTPKVIVLEGYMTKLDEDYMDDSRIIKNNYGMHWSLNRLNSLKASAPRERWAEFMLANEQYHKRYTELSSGDFLKNQNYTLYDDWKGLGLNMATTPLEMIDVTTIDDRKELYGKTEKYYRMIIELAKSKDIPIVVVISPYAGITEERMQQFNKAYDIAKEYDVPYINYNLFIEDMGLEFLTDAADPAHLNYKGNQKFTAYFGRWLNSEFDIPDHRGDKDYESWQRNADYIREMIYNQQLLECYNTDTISLKLCNENYWVVISIDGSADVYNPVVSKFLNDMGIEGDEDGGMWLRENNGVIWASGSENSKQYIRSKSHDFCLERRPDENGFYANYVIMDRVSYKMVPDGINVVVFDSKTECMVDVFAFDKNCDYAIVR